MKVFSFILFFININCHTLNSMELIWQKLISDEAINKIIIDENRNIALTISSDNILRSIYLSDGNILSDKSFDITLEDIFIDRKNTRIALTLKENDYASILLIRDFDFTILDTIDVSYLLNPNISLKNQEFMEINSVISDDNIILGIGTYTYDNANHYYKGRIDKIDIETEDTLNIFKGGMITNIELSPNGQYIAFTTLYKASIFIKPNVYKEIETSELHLTDKNLNKITKLRTDHKEDFGYVDTEIINDIRFSNDSKLLLAATDEHHLFTYSTPTRDLVDSIYSCDCYGDQATDFYRDDHHIISCTNNGIVNIWNLDYDILVDSYTFGDSPYLLDVKAHSDSNYILVSDYKGKLSLLIGTEIIENVNEKKSDINIVFNNSTLFIKSPSIILKDVRLYDILGRKINCVYFKDANNYKILKLKSFNLCFFVVIETADDKILKKFIMN